MGTTVYAEAISETLRFVGRSPETVKDTGIPLNLLEDLALKILYLAGELSHRVVNEALQIHGGYGFMDEYPISRMYRDQKINEIGEGTNEVQRLILARLMGL